MTKTYRGHISFWSRGDANECPFLADLRTLVEASTQDIIAYLWMSDYSANQAREQGIADFRSGSFATISNRSPMAAHDVEADIF
jgi:hypothetical protein